MRLLIIAITIILLTASCCQDQEARVYQKAEELFLECKQTCNDLSSFPKLHVTDPNLQSQLDSIDILFKKLIEGVNDYNNNAATLEKWKHPKLPKQFYYRTFCKSSESIKLE